MQVHVAAALAYALLASAKPIMVSGSLPRTLEFGETIAPKVVLRNVSTEIVRLSINASTFSYRLGDTRGAGVAGMAPKLQLPGFESVALAPGEERHFRLVAVQDLDQALADEVRWIPGLLMPGRYRVRIHIALADVDQSDVELEFEVVEGMRASEYAQVEKVFRSIATTRTGRGRPLRALAAQMKECCQASPVRRALWALACRELSSEEASQCATEFLGEYPNDALRPSMKDIINSFAKSKVLDEYLRRRERASSRAEHAAAAQVRTNGALPERQVTLAREFLAKYPASGFVPEVLCLAAIAADKQKLREDARAFARELAARFPDDPLVAQARFSACREDLLKAGP